MKISALKTSKKISKTNNVQQKPVFDNKNFPKTGTNRNTEKEALLRGILLGKKLSTNLTHLKLANPHLVKDRSSL